MRRLLAALIRRRLLVLAATFLVVAGCVALIVRLRLVTDFAALLPTDDPAVVATQQIQARLGTATPLYVAVESGDRSANLRYATDLAAALSRDSDVHVSVGIQAERAFFDAHWWLYLSLEDLQKIRDRLVREVRWKKNPLLVSIDDDGESLDQLEARLRKRTSRFDRFPDDYFQSKDGTLVVVVLTPRESLFREHAGESIVRRTRAVISQTPPPAGIHVELAGALHDAVLERHALQSDLAWSSIACLVLVSLVVALFFGRVRAIPLMAAPALVGVAIALATGSVAFGQLNASTAFLGSIILGNGINAAIIQLARYQDERRAGIAIDEAIVRSVTGTMRATGTASLAASIAYGSLTLTSFRGFSQFGVIGAVGMVASWLATLVVLPALLATFDRRDLRARRSLQIGAPFRPRVVLAATALITAGAVSAMIPALRDPFEYDLRKLRSLQGTERRALGQRIEAILGTQTPTVLLADTREHANEAATILRERAKTHPGVLGDVATIDTLVPAQQDAKIVVIDEIRTLLAEARPDLEPDQATKLAKWEPPPVLGPIAATDLPDMIARPFRAVDGTFVPVVIALRAPELSYWDGHDLLRLAALVRTVPLADGTRAHAGGNAVVFAGMVDAIVHDGPIATLASLLGVILLVIVLARRGAPIVLGALLVGVVWMAGAAALTGAHLNFLNFIALPLTFGIGVDYAVNIYLAPNKRTAGGAVALCSLTTTIGYASLLVADSQGLRSFGTLAILGELACVTVALLVVPAWLQRGRPNT